MSCRPPCCKRDPERQCSICFTDQTWSMEIPSPIVQGGRGRNALEDSTTDKIVDGAGDASVGTCGGATGRDGSNGYDSHTYIDCTAKGRLSVDWPTRKGTEDGDSIIRNPPALWDETLICNQFIGNRIYSVTQLLDHNFAIFDYPQLYDVMPQISDIFIRGEFYIPSAPVLAGTFTKTFQFRSGADRGSSANELWNRVLDDDFTPRLDYLRGAVREEMSFVSSWQFNAIAYVKGWLEFVAYDNYPDRFPLNYQVENGDDITNADYSTKSLNDRRLFLKTRAKGNVNGDDYRRYDTGLTLRDYIDGGVFVENTVEQISITPVLSFGNVIRYDVLMNVTYKIPQSQFEVTEQVLTQHGRCDRGTVRLIASPRIKPQRHWPTEGILKTGYNFDNDITPRANRRVANHDPAWWINELEKHFLPRERADNKHMMLLPWINHFEITNGNFSDTANFIVARLLHKNTSGEIKNAFYATDFGGVTIPDGQTVEVGEVETGDTFELGLDNLGEVTTECSSITIDNPFLIAIDDSSPTLLPYDFTTVTVTGEPLVVDGTADIVITHDQGGTIIPSPWTITLDGTAPLPVPP